jgi:hypothetical protein
MYDRKRQKLIAANKNDLRENGAFAFQWGYGAGTHIRT